MKRYKNIFMALAVLLAFTACSDNNEGPEVPQNDARVLVSFLSPTSYSTKAETGVSSLLEGENHIHNLTALFFDMNDQIVQHAWATPASDNEGEITNIQLISGAYKMVLLANAPQGTFGEVTTLAQLREKTLNISSQSQAMLTMSSELITCVIEPGNNYIGYSSRDDNALNTNGVQLKSPIQIVRIPARIDVGYIKTRFEGSDLEGREVRIDAIRFENVKTVARYYNAIFWGAVEESGNVSTKEMNLSDEIIVNDQTPFAPEEMRFYTMENSDENGATRVQVTATILKNETYEEQTKLFSAVINRNGKIAGFDHDLVKRNYIYQLLMTFGPTSFENITEPDPVPEETNLDLKVEVVRWGEVIQNPIF